jgi:3-oxoacyl-[acyl-carrier protein] reductase
VSQEAAAHFNPNGGSIVNISSGVSTLTPPGSAVYTATKASVDAITAVLAKELAPRKIRVNSVNPGMIITEGVKAAGYDQGDMRQWIESITPLGRVGKVEEIANTVAFFASDGASYITGETLHVTGGPR